jgi:uncharacterized membrane protein
MNLDLIPLGWVHFIASLVAIAAAVIVLARPKGTAAHKRVGRIYVVAILVTSATALGIYRLGIFFFPHWLAIASLVTTAIAFAAAHLKWPRAGWVHIHLTMMLATVYNLIGGGINEVYLRVDALRRFSGGLGSPMVGRTHTANLLFFVALIVFFNVRETTAAARCRRPRLNLVPLPTLDASGGGVCRRRRYHPANIGR